MSCFINFLLKFFAHLCFTSVGTKCAGNANAATNIAMSVHLRAPAWIRTRSLINNCNDASSNCTHFAQLSLLGTVSFFSLETARALPSRRNLAVASAPKIAIFLSTTTIFRLCLRAVVARVMQGNYPEPRFCAHGNRPRCHWVRRQENCGGLASRPKTTNFACFHAARGDYRDRNRSEGQGLRTDGGWSLTLGA